MRIAFFGTPEAAVPSLLTLADAEGIDLVAVVTNPARPAGRSGRPVAPPVAQAAAAAGVPVWQPERARDVAARLASLRLDACAVVAYGSLLPPAVLETATAGFVNLHFSLLPRWRGAAPVFHALREGDQVTGVTTFVLDEGMDTGPVLRQVETAIGADETGGELLARLAELGAPVLAESVRAVVAGASLQPQPTDGVTYAPKVAPGDVAIDWSAPRGQVADLVRAANPAPGAHCRFRDRRTKVLRTRPYEWDGPPGEVVAIAEDGPVVAVGDGALSLTELQPEGRPRMDGAAFVRGYHPRVGESFAS